MNVINIEQISRQMYHDEIAFGMCGAVLTPDGIRTTTVGELEELEKNGTKISDEAFYKLLQKQDF